MGVLLSVIFGAANAYLGLRVGMTVSASIPAAVISMGIIRIILRRNSVLESNIVQTIGSAGESVAAGAIFTLPALFLWASEGKMDKPGIVEITCIALVGGLLGIFFMVPLRNALIVKELGILPYPEGTACAEVLLAGEKGGASAATVFADMGFAALFKFVIDGLKLVSGEISYGIKKLSGEIGTQIYPAVLSVGYICGARIASFMFAGGVLSWLVIIPMIILFGADTIMYPRTETIGEMYAAGGAGAIWSSYIRYIGAGALAAGMCSAIAIGSIICIVSAIAGDTSQDLKTGYILGSTPKKQQIGEIIGVVCSALAIGGTLYLLDSAYGFGSDQIAAPQATLMKLIVEGVMGGKLPWNLVFIGAIIAVIVEIIRIPVLPFAIGIYLPVQLNACIMVGGLIRLAMDKMKKTEEEKKEITNDGILFCSGMIAGEGLVGILLAFLAVLGADKAIDISAKLGLSGTVMNIGGLVLFGIIILTVLKFSLWKKRAKNNE